jgi:hypothetical protein
MKLIETGFKQIEIGFEHYVTFEFEGRQFTAYVEETQNETFVKDVFYLVPLGNRLAIDIPKYFGSFSSDVFTFIYDNIQEGF